MISLAFGYIATSCFSRAFITNFSVFNSDSYCSQKQPPEVFCNKGALRNSQEKTCVRVSFLIKLQAEVSNFIKKETLGRMFFCEFCEISKNTFFKEHLRTTVFIVVHFYQSS